MSSEDYSNIKPGGKIVDDYSHIKPGGKIADDYTGGKIQQTDKDQAWNKINQQYPNLPTVVKRGLFNFVVNRLEKSGQVLPRMDSDAQPPQFGKNVAEDMLGLSKDSAMPSFGRGLMSSPLELAANLQGKLPGYPEALKDAPLPKGIAVTRRDKRLHPWSTFAGQLAGGALPFAEGGALLEGLPVVGKSLELMKQLPMGRYLKLATEGAGLGAAFAPEGQEGQWAATGAALGPAGEAVMSGARGLPSGWERLKNMLPGSDLSQTVEGLGEKAESAKQSDMQAQEALDEAKALAKHQKHASDADVLTGDINELHNQLLDAKEKLDPNKISLPASLNVDPKAIVDNAQQHADDAADLVKSNKQDIMNYIPDSEEKDTKLRDLVVDWFENKIKGPASGDYKEFEESLKNHPIPVGLGEQNIDDVIGELPEKYQGYVTEANKKQLLDQLGKPLEKQASAYDAYKRYQALRNQALEARQAQFMDTRDAEGKVLSNADEQAKWKSRADKLEEMADDTKDRLRKTLPDTLKETMDKLAANWRDVVKPIGQNKVYATLAKTGQYNGDIIHALRGMGESPAESTGRRLLREKIQKHPEMNRLALGMKFAKNPEKLLNDYEEAVPYLQKNPILSSKVENWKNALDLKEAADSGVPLAKQRSEQLKSQKAMYPDNQELMGKIKSIEDTIKSKQASRDRLLEARKNKKLAAKERLKIEMQLKKHSADLERARKDRRALLIAVSAALGAPYAVYKISGLL